MEGNRKMKSCGANYLPRVGFTVIITNPKRKGSGLGVNEASESNRFQLIRFVDFSFLVESML